MNYICIVISGPKANNHKNVNEIIDVQMELHTMLGFVNKWRHGLKGDGDKFVLTCVTMDKNQIVVILVLPSVNILFTRWKFHDVIYGRPTLIKLTCTIWQKQLILREPSTGWPELYPCYFRPRILHQPRPQKHPVLPWLRSARTWPPGWRMRAAW